MSSIGAHNPSYTPNNIDYTYIDSSVGFSREYFYKIVVTTESILASATPTFLPFATIPSSPGNIVSQVVGNDVSLTWDVPTGSPTGYRVFRSQYYPIVDCESVFWELVATTTATSFLDIAAPQGVPVFYYVQSYNDTGASELSAGAAMAVTTDVVDGLGNDIPDQRKIHDFKVLANGSGFHFSLRKSTRATIAIYDVRGRLVAVPHSQPSLMGINRVEWAGTWRNKRIGSGVYFARLTTPNGEAVSQKFVMVR